MGGTGIESFESSGTSKPCLAVSEMLRLGRGVEMAVGEKFASARVGVLGSEVVGIGRFAREVFLLSVWTK